MRMVCLNDSQHLTPVAFECSLAGMIEHPDDLYVLFVLHRPAKNQLTGTESLLWKDFLINFGNTLQLPGVDDELHNKPECRLAENIWLIPLKDGQMLLGRLVTAAKMVGLPYKMIYFDDVPPWSFSEHGLRLPVPEGYKSSQATP
jgi:hypothetical protein